MRRVILASAILTVILTMDFTAAFACGDKTLRIGRGARFRRTGHAAAILIYVPSDAAAVAVQRAPRLQSFLKNAGHKALVVQGRERLGEALESGRYDLVLGNLVEAAGLQKPIESSSSKPTLVPIVSKATKAEVIAAQKQYRYLVKDANSGDDYLNAIEEAMRSRIRILAKKV